LGLSLQHRLWLALDQSSAHSHSGTFGHDFNKYAADLADAVTRDFLDCDQLHAACLSARKPYYPIPCHDGYELAPWSQLGTLAEAHPRSLIVQGHALRRGCSAGVDNQVAIL
jgi:hypothetical protein